MKSDSESLEFPTERERVDERELPQSERMTAEISEGA